MVLGNAATSQRLAALAREVEAGGVHELEIERAEELREFIRGADERWKATSSGSTRAMSRTARRGGARTKNLAEKIAALREKRGRY
jgi:hypothetical protein